MRVTYLHESFSTFSNLNIQCIMIIDMYESLNKFDYIVLYSGLGQITSL